MRVGFDAHAIGRRQTGNETYAAGLLSGLERIGVPVLAYGYEPPPHSIHGWRRLPGKSRWRRIAIDVPLAAARDHLDLYHGSYALPPLLPCRSVVTIHDLTFIAHPEWLPRGHARSMRLAVGHALRKASGIIAVSERTREDIIAQYDVPAERITVTHLAPRPAIVTGEPLPALPKTHFLYVGTITPRKNVAVLVRAMALLRDRGLELPLVLAGHVGAAEDEIRTLIGDHRLEGQVRFAGYVSDSVLRDLYATCVALVHPAHYEGFGLPPLEAMALGRPVLAAATGSLPEVIGDAGLLLAPEDAGAWADAMERILSADVSRELVELGLERARQFSWERCARETVGVYRAARERA